MRLIVLAVLACTACAHTPIPPDRQADYFGCQASIEEVERTLASAGFPMATVSASTITTETLTLKLETSEVVRVAAGTSFKILHPDYTAKFVVVKQDQGISFSLFLGGIKVDPIIEEQLSHPATKRELNRLRSIVCGGGDFF